ncbi:hypothetical protein ILP97_43770 [Amycolatopsis sp. H6(2020)]|nr:hypothetical protein [Amycolatopsis sp. H6(2020)]
MKSNPGAVLTVGVTALVTGAVMGAFAHAVTATVEQDCAAELGGNPGSLCVLGPIIYGPVIVVVSALFAGFVMWPALAIAAIEPRRRVLTGAFLLPAVLVEPFGVAAWVHAPPILVTALALGVVQAWIAFATGARLTRS